MSFFFRWIPTLPLIAGLSSSAVAQSAAPPVPVPEWPVSSAPARLVVEPEVRGKAGTLGVAELELPDPNWAIMPIRVYADNATAVGSDILWTVPGGPVTLLFDSSSGAPRYQVYLGSNYPPMHLADTKVGVWLESRQGNGQMANTLPDMLKAWNQSTKVNGRAVVGGIWEGGNRFGPQGSLLTHLQGWFDLPAPQHLQFATISVDSSFVLIDGKEVVEWPGHHDRWWGPAGPPQGAVDLAAGPHVVDYYNSYELDTNDNPMPLTCCLSVKGGAFADWTMLTPDSHFFRPIVTTGSNSYNLQKDTPGGIATGNAPGVSIKWKNQDQSVIYTDQPDIGFIEMRFDCNFFPLKSDTVNWTFDDGTTVQGQNVTNLFLRPGMRTVHVSLKDGDKEVAALTQTIYIHPDWAHAGPPPQLIPKHVDDVMSSNPATFSASDLVSCYAIFAHYLKPEALLKLLPAVCAKMNDIADADLPYIKTGALLLAHDEWNHDADEIQLLRALIDRAGKGTPTPVMQAMDSECKLALARLIYKTSDNLDEAKSLVATINPADLTGDEPRVLQILKADMTLAGGDIPGARKQYEALTGEPSGPDVRSSIRRTAKIQQARAYIDMKDFDSAEDSLNEVAWGAPIEKISPDWALTRLRLYQEENLPVLAYVWAKRLLPVITETGRSELLYRLTDLAFVQKDDALAQKTLSELLQKHPYSEEAAQAKEKWPGK